MSGKVFHINDGIHELVVQYCKCNNIPIKLWVESILVQAVKTNEKIDVESNVPLQASKVAPLVTSKKKLENYSNYPTYDGDELWSRPPFWIK